MSNKDFVVSPKKMKSFIDSNMNKMLKDKDFTASQVPYIIEIGGNEGISMKDLCFVLGADKGLATRVIKTLIENGFVENRSGSSRTYSLYLTDKGKEARDLAIGTLEKTLGQVFECLDEEEMETFRRISMKLDRRLDELYKY